MRCTFFNLTAFAALLFFAVPAFADGAVDAADAAPAVEEAPVAEEAEEAPVAEEAPAAEVAMEDIVVPEEGTPAEYMAFIEKMMRLQRPKTQSREEMIAFFKKVCNAQVAAANKIIENKESDETQLQRAVSAKINSLRILMQAGDESAQAQLYAMPEQLEKAGYDKIAHEISMGLMSMTFQAAAQTKDFSAIEKLIVDTDAKIKAAGEDKEKLQNLYLIKLLCTRAISELKEEKNQDAFNAVVEEIKAAGLDEMVRDIQLGEIMEQLSKATQENDKEVFTATAEKFDSMLESAGENIDVKLAGVAFQIAFAEEVFDTKTAQERYEKYAKLLAKSEDEKVKNVAKTLEGSARRLGLVGNEIVLTGKTLDGKDFNLTDLKGKLVLINFWAASVRPCMEELVFLFQVYPFYQEKGFEVVSISMDENKEELVQLLSQVKFPWFNLWEKDTKSGDTSIAEYYGIVAIPCMILVGKDGKVLSADARGETLKKLLAEQLGEMPAQPEPEGVEIDESEEIEVPAELEVEEEGEEEA